MHRIGAPTCARGGRRHRGFVARARSWCANALHTQVTLRLHRAPTTSVLRIGNSSSSRAQNVVRAPSIAGNMFPKQAFVRRRVQTRAFELFARPASEAPCYRR